MSNIILEKIKHCKLSKTEARIAEYIANNLNTICFMTATDLAKTLQTSDASVIRLSRALGFRGFSDMQRAIQGTVTAKLEKANQRLLSPLERLSADEMGPSSPEIVTRFMETAIGNIQSAVSKNSLKTFAEAVNTICAAKKIHIFGFRGCKGLADWMGLLLNHMIPNVRWTTTADAEAIEDLLDITEDDCILLFSFYRYSSMALKIARIAQERKAKLIVFTENYTSPVAQGANHVFIIDVHSQSFFNSHVGGFFAIELILTLISKKIGSANAERLKFIEENIKDLELY